MPAITKAAVEALTPGKTIWDSEVRGFCCRCQKRDRIFGLKSRRGGKQRWLTIGLYGSPWTVATARDEARRLLVEIVQGGDPAGVRDANKRAPTVAQAAERFIAERVRPYLKQRTVDAYARVLRQRIVPALGTMRVADVRRADLSRIIGSLRGEPALANQTIAIAGALFGWAERVGLRPEGAANPARGIERFRTKSRERFLSAEEYGKLGGALDQAEREAVIPAFSIAAIRLLALSGMRRNEVRLLKWSEVQFERGVIELSDSKTGPKVVQLNPAALQVLSTLPRLAGNDHVFAGGNGRAIGALKDHWVKLRELAGLPTLRMHDLRHSFASTGAAAGLGLPILGKLLGHASVATTAKYAHLADDPVRAATVTIGNRIAAALERKPSASIHKLR